MPSFVPAIRIAAHSSGADASDWLDQATIAILEAADEFLWSEEMSQSLDAFMTNHASMFAGAKPDGEQRLEWTQAHRDFQELYELQLEGFIAAQSFSAEEFAKACQDALDHGDDWADGHTSATMVEGVLASASYEHFVEMMASAAAEAAATGAGGAEVEALFGPLGPALREAAEQGAADEIAALLAAGADANEADPASGATPLHLAVASDDTASIQALLEAGAAFSALNADGFSPLHEAALGGSGAATELLVQAGASWSQPTGQGETALGLASVGSAAAAVLERWAAADAEGGGEPAPEQFAGAVE
eukprot:COSAG05_NODE_2963_length_2459_cov_2.922458_3_plen_306_part_00